MATAPTICFNDSSASSDDYFNHHEIYTPVSLYEIGKPSLNTGQISEVKNIFISHNHTDEITDVSFYVIPYTGSTAAEIIGTTAENFNIQNGVNDLFIIKIDEREFNYEITLTSGSNQTAQNICDDINNVINELIAFVDLGNIKLISPSKGLNSKIYIIDTNNTANTVLGFIGNDLIPINTGSTNNWGSKGNGARGKSVGNIVSYPFTITSGTNNQFNVSLNFTSNILCTIQDSTVNNDSEFELLINTAFINAGFSTTTDLVSTVNSGILIITSFSTQDNSYVQITSGTNDAISTIGMSNPTETGTDYANSSAIVDRDELITWGDSGCGLELGDPSFNYSRVITGNGDSQVNGISLTWGDGSTVNDLAKFDYYGGDSDGEVELKIQLSVPSDESETGYREWSLAVQFTYI